MADLNAYGVETPPGFTHEDRDLSRRRVTTRYGDASGLALTVDCESDEAADQWNAGRWGHPVT